MSYASWRYRPCPGHVSEPIRPLDPPGRLDVVAEDDPAELLGRAHLSGWLIDGRRPVPTYRLLIGDEELPGLFTCFNLGFKLVEA
jgi:hypothetical protein